MKPNYAYSKRQKELAKKAKNEQKQARKREKPADTIPLGAEVPVDKQSG